MSKFFSQLIKYFYYLTTIYLLCKYIIFDNLFILNTIKSKLIFMFKILFLKFKTLNIVNFI